MRKKIRAICCFIMALAVMFVFLPMDNSYAGSNDSRKIVVFKENKGHVDKDKILKKHGAVKVKDIKETEQPEEIIPWGIQYVGAPEIWETNCGEGLKVAVIDTGVDIDHPDLVDNIKGGTNTISKKGSYDDDNGHGTHVAGIIAAVDNEIGVVGVVPEAELYAVKTLDSYGNGYVSDIIEGILWCIENDIDIINMSFGMTADSQLLHESVSEAFNARIEMVAAAGNNYGGDCEFPAAYNEVIGVGAFDINGNIAEFSAVDGVDVWAPGTDIYSTYVGETYKDMDGTSMATPHWILMMLKNRIY